MTGIELIQAKCTYERQHRSINVHRYVASTSFRSMYPEDFGFRFDPTTMDLPHDELGRRLQLLEDNVRLIEMYLTNGQLDDEEMKTLGVDPEEVKALGKSYNPIKRPIPDGLIIMTFDDATLDHYTKAAPILEKFGARGVFFVCEMAVGLDGGTGFSDKRRYMDWRQIRELSQRGHEIANHTLTHRFNFLHITNKEKMIDIQGIETKCVEKGIPAPTVFGYPGGSCNMEAIELLHSLGYKWGRGDLLNSGRSGQSYYDPLVDSPLAIPGFNGAPMFNEKQLARIVALATQGRIVVLAYHGIDNADFGDMRLEEQLTCIYDYGGRCITFGQLEQYVDPTCAYRRWKL